MSRLQQQHATGRPLYMKYYLCHPVMMSSDDVDEDLIGIS